MLMNFLGNRIPSSRARVRGHYRGVRRQRPKDKEIVWVEDGRMQAERRDADGRRTVLVTVPLVPGAVSGKVRHESDTAARVVPTAAVASFVVVRVKSEIRNGHVSTREGRRCLTRCNKLFGAIFTSIYGPKVVYDDVRSVVEVRVPCGEDLPVGELVAAGFRFSNAGSKPGRLAVYEVAATDEATQFALDWSWRHAGVWFTARKLTQQAMTWLQLSDWVAEITCGRRPTSASGTNEHMRQFHTCREVRAKIKSARRAALKAARWQADSDFGRKGEEVFPGGKDLVKAEFGYNLEPISFVDKPKVGYKAKVPGDSMRGPGGYLLGENFHSSVRPINIDSTTLAAPG